MQKRLSVKTAIILPFFIVMIMMALVIYFVWISTYQVLADQHGSRVVSALSKYTQEKIDSFFGEPHRLNQLYAQIIQEFGTSTPEAIERNRIRTSAFLRLEMDDLPQIRVASFGDEDGRYLGYRINDDQTFSLMQKDESTDLKLAIFSGDNAKTELLASYDQYDPRKRPWYTPVKLNPVPQWSTIYVNLDEKNETTISTITPIISNGGKFTGVTAIDVKLDGIHEFLKEETTKGSGLIYIVDRDWNLVAQSGSSQTYKTVQGDTLTAVPLSVSESEDPIISESGNIFRKSSSENNQVSRQHLNGESYYIQGKEVDPQLNLGWKIIVAIPESEIMGLVKDNINVSIFTMFVLIVVVMIVGFIAVNPIVLSLSNVAKSAVAVSEGQWGIIIPNRRQPFQETYELVTSFNRMSLQIKENLDELSKMHHREKDELEALVKVRTEELELTINELFNREKLASLVSLVSGISHEVNTPLGVSVTAASFMEQANKDIKESIVNNTITKTEFKNYIENMEETVGILNTNLARAAQIIKSFKEIAVNQVVEEQVKFSMLEYVQMVIVSLKHEYKHTNHEFSVMCGEDIILLSYPGAWSQILTNLIMNALKHAFEPGYNGIINIEVMVSERELILFFSDNGKGIDEIHRNRIFEPFYTTSRGNGGSGLGLNVVYNLVTAVLGGTITVSSEINQGTSFKIVVPR